jgi:hypothetical protein
VRARPQAILVLFLLTALMLPSAASAQSAGDEQYTDPFGGEGQQEQQQSQGQQPETSAEPVEEPAPPEPSTAAEPSGEAAGASAESSDPSLPVTGLPALAMLLGGASMLAAGAVVRRRA